MNNDAVLALEVNRSAKVNVEIEYSDGKKVVKSMTIFAPNVEKSIEAANAIVISILNEV